MDKLIVCNIHELKDFLPKNKKIGAWWISHALHNGHIKVLKKVKENTEYVIGIYLNNYYQIIQHVTGFDTGSSLQLSLKSLVGLISNTDIVHLGCWGHIPYDIHTADCLNEKQLPTHSLPEYIRYNPRTLSLLRSAQAVVRKTQEITGYTYHAGGMKDYWRPYAAEWARKYLGFTYDEIESERDEFGNSISSSFLKWQKITNQVVDFQMLLTEHNSMEDVQRNINNHGIKNLHIIDFIDSSNMGYKYIRLKATDIVWTDYIKIGD